MEQLVYDRTQLDVDFDTEKGSYNFSDLNRIENWCQYLSKILNSYNYNNIINVKTDWVMVDAMTTENSPTEAQMERIRQNLIILRNAFFTLSTTPATPENLDFMTFQKANDIEKILFDIDKVIEHMENFFIYCGVPNCGQERIWQQRFRKPKTWNAQPYKLSQYAKTDTLAMIATDNNESIESSTKILGFAEIDKRDDVYASINAINDSMQAIDDLVGYECEFYTLTNLCPAIDGVNGFNIRSNSGTATGESSTAHTKYSQQALKLNILDTNTTEVYAISTTTLPLIPEHIYYARLEAYQEDLFGSMEIYFPIAEPHFFNIGAKSTGQWNMYSTVIDRSSFTAGNYTFRLDFNRERSTATTGSVWYDGWMIIDLTETFGIGNEPDLDWCNANIPYFTGTQIIKIRKESA